MKYRYLVGLAIFALTSGNLVMAATPTEIAQKITWYGQSSVRIAAGGKIIWIDPIFIATPEKADIVLITHSHTDHYNYQAIERLGPPPVLIGGFDIPGGVRMFPGETKVFDGITIRTVPAYNLKRDYHTKESKNVGYLITVEGVTIYLPGDTERIPEMKDFKCDIAFMPLGQTYTMRSVDDAIAAVLDVGASIAFPYHWGQNEGKKKDAVKFVEALKSQGVDASLLISN